ncbi:hypothetical protein Hanom_Chr10g00947551 [Helianthus anomalus]
MVRNRKKEAKEENGFVGGWLKLMKMEMRMRMKMEMRWISRIRSCSCSCLCMCNIKLDKKACHGLGLCDLCFHFFTILLRAVNEPNVQCTVRWEVRLYSFV